MLKGLAPHPKTGKQKVVAVSVKAGTATFGDGEQIKLDPKKPIKIVNQ